MKLPLGALLGPVSSSATSVALFGISHTRPLSHSASRDLYFQRLAINHLAVKLLNCSRNIVSGLHVLQ